MRHDDDDRQPQMSADEWREYTTDERLDMIEAVFGGVFMVGVLAWLVWALVSGAPL